MATVRTLIINTYYQIHIKIFLHTGTNCPLIKYIYNIYIIINKLTRGQLRGQVGDKQGQMAKCPLSQNNAKGTKIIMSPVCPQLSPCLSPDYNLINQYIICISGDKWLNMFSDIQFNDLHYQQYQKTLNR